MGLMLRSLLRGSFTPSWLGKHKSYNDYVASGGRKGKASGSYWRDDELDTLRAMVQRQVSQLEIMQEFPYRRWIQIQCRIKELFGKGTRVPRIGGGINQRLTYVEYLQQQESHTPQADHESAESPLTVQVEPCSETKMTVFDRCPNTLPAFFDRRVWQADNRERRDARAGVKINFDINNRTFNANEGARMNGCKH